MRLLLQHLRDPILVAKEDRRRVDPQHRVPGMFVCFVDSSRILGICGDSGVVD